jgi:D-3-phosphoglycerate dehydrogenase / 2-oxoglutarate reductase
MKVVVAEKIAGAAMKLLEKVDGWKVVGPDEFARDPKAAVADADALIVRSAVRASAELIGDAKLLRVIGRSGVGVDNIDVDVATKRGIVVMNTPGASSVSVAELTIGLMLSMARFIPKADQSTRAGKWEKKELQGSELAGKTLGLVGLGRIGTEVAKRAQAFGMTVIGTDPYVSPARAHELGIKLCSLDELYAAADYISLHVGLTHQTTRMINRDAIAKMKDSVRIVNCARGELIDDEALGEAMSSGKVASAALDVFTQEPPKGNALLQLPNLVATPHLGASTKEGQEATGIQIASQIRDYLLQGIAQNAVNLPSLSDQEYEQLRPYIALASKLGSFAAQLFASNLSSIEIEYEGELGSWKTDFVRNAAVAGVMQSGSEEAVNLINARTVADQRGVVVRETRSDPKAKVNGVQLKLTGETGGVQCRGAVVHGEYPRLTELNETEIESRVEGNFIVIFNDDSPGVVGGIGTALATHGINIARLSLGRKGKNAVAIVQVDSAVGADVLAELKKVRSVKNAVSVKV